jgi:outer membrane protein
MNTKLLSGILVLLLTVSAAFAQHSAEPPLIKQETPVSVEELIRIALDNEATYQQALEDESLIGAMTRGAIGTFLPSASLSGSLQNSHSITKATIVNGVTVAPGSDNEYKSSNWTFSLNEDIFTGGSRYYGYKSAKLNIQNLRHNAKRSKDILIANVKTYYYNYLAAKRNLKVQEEVLAQQQESLRLANARFQTGDVIELDVMQADIDVGTQENMVLQARQAVENARESLNMAAGLDLNSNFPVTGELDPVLPEFNLNNLINVSLTSRPDYLMRKNMVDMRKYDIKTVNADYMPSLSAYYGYNRSESGNDYSFSPEDKATYYGIQMRWNLFDGFNREYRRQNAIVNKRKAQWDEYSQRLSIEASVRQQWRSLENLYKQTQVSDKNRELARRQLELEQERYRVGASNQLSLRSAQVTFTSAEQNHLRNVLDFYITLATLERDLGVSFNEIQ